MKLIQKLSAWKRNLFRKRRLNMLDAMDNSEIWHMHLSPAGIFAGFTAFVILLFIIILLLVAYTPVMEFLPGYRSEAERTRENLVENIIRIDSLERVMHFMMTYNENIGLIMEGRTPVARTITASTDSLRTKKCDIVPSREDSLLREQMEGEGPYSLSGNENDKRQQLRESMELPRPIEGIITSKFDIKSGNFGVKILAAGGDIVTAIANGTVVMSLWTPSGHIIGLQHSNNMISVYKNLSQSLVTTGQRIRASEQIGYSAEQNEKESEARLFEFELWNNGKPVNPEEYIVFQ